MNTARPTDGVEPVLMIQALARRHSLLFFWTPLGGVMVAVLGWPRLHPTWYDLWAGVTLWAVSMLGITVGYHRLCTHRAFRSGPVTTLLLVGAGSLAGNFPVINWCTVHRRHHQRSDQPGDPHSPNLQGDGWRGFLRGIVHTQFGWIAGYPCPNPMTTVRDLLQDPSVMWVNRHYAQIVLGGVVAPAVVRQVFDPGWIGFLSTLVWAGFLRLLLVQQMIFTVNSLGHRLGSRPYATVDQSRNNPLVAALTMGEGWHNNHHRFPASAYLGLRWWELDPGAWLISLLRTLGLARDVLDPRKSAFDEHSHEDTSLRN